MSTHLDLNLEDPDDRQLFCYYCRLEADICSEAESAGLDGFESDLNIEADYYLWLDFDTREGYFQFFDWLLHATDDLTLLPTEGKTWGWSPDEKQIVIAREDLPRLLECVQDYNSRLRTSSQDRN